MLKKILFLFFICVSPFLFCQQVVLFPQITGKQLRDSLVTHFKPLNVLPYDIARDSLFGIVDIHKGYVQCIYTGDSIIIVPDSIVPPRTQASNKGYSTEHAYPQSMGAATGNPKSNLHHLFPTRQDVNSSRSNLPYKDVPDSLVTRWWRLNYSQTNIPDTLKEEYSKRSSSGFEVRDVSKGNAARAAFYFFTMYQNEAENTNPDFFHIQLPFIKRWHFTDPPDSLEYVRNSRIAPYQMGYINPFIVDTTLINRAYGIAPPRSFALELLNETQIKLSWIKNNNNDKVLIIRNQTGMPDAPLDGIAYQNGQTALNGYVIISDEDSLVDNLPQMGTYYYRIFSATDTNTYSICLFRFLTTGFTDAIHYWNFNNNVPESGLQWPNIIPSVSGNAMLWHQLSDVQSFQGSLLNTLTNDVSGGSFCPRGMLNNDSSIVIYAPTTGYKDIVFSYTTRGTSTGYNVQSIFYSTDGANFDSLTSFTASNFDWIVRTLDFSNMNNVNDNDQFFIKIKLSGASSTLGNNRFDNFKITGNDKFFEVEEPLVPPFNINVYPNPAKDILYLDICTLESGSICCEIYSLKGEKVYKTCLSSIAKNKTYTLNIGQLSKGLYVLKLVNNNRSVVKKLAIF